MGSGLTALVLGSGYAAEGHAIALQHADVEVVGLARKTGLKTAYAATTRYQPQLVYARELVRQGVVGRVSELELVSHTHQPRLMPYGWIHRLEDGGGRLYNHFPHALAMAQSI